MYRSMDDPSEEPATVVNTFILEPIGLAVDHQNQRIYWVDNHFKTYVADNMKIYFYLLLLATSRDRKGLAETGLKYL